MRLRSSPALAFLGLGPALFLGVFFAWPVVEVFIRGVSAGSVARLAEPRTFDLLWFTTAQAALSTLLTFAIALPGAWALSRPFLGAGLFRSLVTVAFVLPTVVVAAAFDALARSGLTPFGPRGLAAILAAHVFFNYAVVVRVVGAAWARIPPEVREAGRCLQRTGASVLWRVDLPLLRPALAAAASIVFLFTFTSFGVVLILGDLSTSTIEVEIWRRALHLLDFDGAAALALLQMAAVATGLVAWGRFQKGVGADAGVSRRAPAPRWATGLALLPGVVIVGAPVLALVIRSLSPAEGPGLAFYRTLGGSRQGLTDFVAPATAVTNSMAFAFASGLVALAIGGAAALFVAQKSRRASGRALDAALMLPLGTSAVTLGFGLLVAFDSPPLDLRDNLVLIPLAHALVGIPFVIRALLPALRGLAPSLRETARTLGATSGSIRRRIDLPLVSPAIAVGASFAVAVSLGEFGATSFLSRPSNATVPIAVYRLLGRPGTVNQGQAFALAVILMVMVAAVVLFAEAADGFTSGRRTRPFRRLASRPGRG